MAGPYHGYPGWGETSGISMVSEAATSVCGKGGALENVSPTPLMGKSYKRLDIYKEMWLSKEYDFSRA